MTKLLIVIGMLAVAAPALARQASPAPHPNGRLGSLRAARLADPYRKLFDVQRGLWPALPTAHPATAAPQPKVVCGMTVIEADPNFDRKMIAPKPDGNLKYAIRAIDPPICNPSR